MSNEGNRLLTDRTVQDFGDQWSRYRGNEGWYGSLELFADIVAPLLDPRDLAGKTVAEIGSGTGRIVGMLLQAGVGRVFAIEPSPEAFKSLCGNVGQMGRAADVTTINARGDAWRLPEPADYVLSIGVIHHIPDPAPVIRMAFEALRPGGAMFIWVYGREGNELYLRLAAPLRLVTTRLPHWLLRCVVEVLYGGLCLYVGLGRLVRLPLHDYLQKVLWPMSPQSRRLVIYDQLNPAYAKYYREDEALDLLRKAGFTDVRSYHRHGYSWSVTGKKPAQQS